MLQRSSFVCVLAGAMSAAACDSDSAPPLQSPVQTATALTQIDAGAGPELGRPVGAAELPVDAGSLDAVAIDAGSSDAVPSSSRYPNETAMAGACIRGLDDFCGGSDCPKFDEILNNARADQAGWATRSHCEDQDGKRYITLSASASIYVYDAAAGSLVAVVHFSDVADFCSETAPSAILVFGSPPGNCAYVNHNDTATVCSETSGAEGGALETCIYDFSP